MNKDEMSDDAQFDAQFGALLRGEGDLARRLQAMPQPSPSAQLDAAILENVRASMAPVAREAANDPGAPGARPARGLGMRWRVPAGIAAMVLVGLFARQSYETSVDAVQLSLPQQERDEAAGVQESVAPAVSPAARTASPTPPAKQPLSVQVTPQPKPQPQKPSPRARTPEPVVQADASPVVAAPMAAPSNDILEKMASSAPLAANLADRGGLYTPAQSVTRMATLVKEEEDLAAAREWIMFRERYPDYAAPAGLEAKMKELTKTE